MGPGSGWAVVLSEGVCRLHFRGDRGPWVGAEVGSGSVPRLSGRRAGGWGATVAMGSGGAAGTTLTL